MKAQIISGLIISGILASIYFVNIDKKEENDEAPNETVPSIITSEFKNITLLTNVQKENEEVAVSEMVEQDDEDENLEEIDAESSKKEIEEIKKNKFIKKEYIVILSKEEQLKMEMANLAIRNTEKNYPKSFYQKTSSPVVLGDNMISYKKENTFTEIYLTRFVSELENEGLVFNETYKLMLDEKLYDIKLIKRHKVDISEQSSRRLVFELRVSNKTFSEDIQNKLRTVDLIKQLKKQVI